jgi:hypothetical protein
MLGSVGWQLRDARLGLPHRRLTPQRRLPRRRESFVNDGAPPSALRDLRDRIAHPAHLAVLAGIGLILGLSGPFGTDGALRLVPRISYWLVTTFATYAAGTFAHDLAWTRLPRDFPSAAKVALAGFASGTAVAATVLVLGLAVFGRLPDGLPGFLATLYAIAMVVTVLFHVLERRLAAGAPDAPPPVLDRVPLDRRGALLALSVEDHYVRVHTTRGTHLVLLRLSDAIRETGTVPGLRVHRSHWVARDAVASARREGDRAILTLRDGREVPVSRANLPALRAAGLLPRTR